jgi:hypothetical protein
VKRFAILLCLLLAAPAHAAESRQGYSFDAGNHNVSTPLTLRNRKLAKGVGMGQTTLIAKEGLTGAVIESDGLAKLRAAGLARWEADGVPVGLEVRDLTIEGRGDITPNPHLWRADRPCRLDAIDLWSPAGVVKDVNVFDLPGAVLKIGLGPGIAPNAIQRKAHDREVWLVEHIRSLRTLQGVDIQSGADGVIDDLEIVESRDFGLRLYGAAWLVSRVHPSGVLGDATKDDPDRGCGFINGPSANYYGLGIQPDNCRIGFRNYGTGTTVRELIGKLCSETTIHAVRKLTVNTFNIQTPGSHKDFKHFNPAPRVVVIEPTAPMSIIGDAHSDLSTGYATDAVMFTVRANQCEIRNGRGSWGGGKGSRNTVVEYGSETAQLGGGVIDVWANGYGTGVELTHKIGPGNTIVVHHNGNCPEPIDVGPNEDLSGNDIRIENAQAGTWTTLATMGEAK